METKAFGIPAPFALSVTCPLSENMIGAVAGVDVNTMVSSPIGLRQQVAAALVSTTERVSMASAPCGLKTVLKSPNVCGSVSVRVKTVMPFLSPLMTYGMGVVLE